MKKICFENRHSKLVTVDRSAGQNKAFWDILEYVENYFFLELNNSFEYTTEIAADTYFSGIFYEWSLY